MPNGETLLIPSAVPPRRLKSRLAHREEFYRFDFANGVSTDGPDEFTRAVHDARAELLLPWLDRFAGENWPEMRCVDLACNQGWYAIQLALRGAASVLGIDLRAEHIETANLIAEVSGLSNVTFRQDNLFELDPEQVGTFDMTLLLGLLYHVDNPVEALRRARSLTDGLCFIETQVARSAGELECLWGSGGSRSGPGIAVVPSDEHHVEPGRNVVLVPSLDALRDLLFAVGFQHVSILAAPRDSLEQYANDDRVFVIAST